MRTYLEIHDIISWHFDWSKRSNVQKNSENNDILLPMGKTKSIWRKILWEYSGGGITSKQRGYRTISRILIFPHWQETFYKFSQNVTQKINIFKNFLHMGDLEKNDTIFWKISFQMFCKQIYQILHCKYESDDSHHCKYLPIFISFTIDNVDDNILDCCMFYHWNLLKFSFFINDPISRL